MFFRFKTCIRNRFLGILVALHFCYGPSQHHPNRCFVRSGWMYTSRPCSRHPVRSVPLLPPTCQHAPASPSPSRPSPTQRRGQSRRAEEEAEEVVDPPLPSDVSDVSDLSRRRATPRRRLRHPEGGRLIVVQPEAVHHLHHVAQLPGGVVEGVPDAPQCAPQCAPQRRRNAA